MDYYRLPALALLAALTVACGPAAVSRPAAARPSPSRSSSPSPRPLVVMPPPAAHPNYPPQTLADLVALGDRGLHRRLVGMEDGPIGFCAVAWVKTHELDGTPPEQIAADLVQIAFQRHVFFSSCGGYVYGTTFLGYCNCYLGDHGLLTINRGPDRGEPPGKMLVTFAASDTAASPGDWTVTLDAPDR